MPIRHPLACLAIFAVLLCALPSRAEEVVRWGVADNPPFHILTGPRAGTGYSDIVRRFFVDRMPEYRHVTARMTLARLTEAAREGLDYCYCNLRKTPEREALFYYSDLTALTPGPRLYVRKGSTILDLATDGVISLRTLLDQKKYTGVAELGRAYGPRVRALFEAHRSSLLLQVCPDVARKSDLVNNDRVDFFIEYPFVLRNYVKTEGKMRELVPLRIIEQDAYVLSYVVCTRTEFGKRVVNDINRVLREAKGTAAHRAVFDTPARDLGGADKKEYETLYETFLGME